MNPDIFGNTEPLPVFFLKPGQLFLNKHKPVQRVKIITILGSCISLILTNEKRGMAAMCHAFLPYCPAGENCRGNCQAPYKYVHCALQNMLHFFYKRGLRGKEIKVRLYGGSDMFVPDGEYKKTGKNPSVGRQNSELALTRIRAADLCLTACETGGVSGRRILFFPHSGEIQVRRLKRITGEVY
ncbi:MAG: chemotaxis protein CheD [Desulfococcaceae bacterium]|jgi:chemotaxis protein CheD|nr:chemotaxis protein CheD [Desulfococcaceae bacterium]